MPVHTHPDGLARLATAVEELACAQQRDVDQLASMGEVDRLDIQRAWRRHDDQVSVSAMSLDVVDQATVSQQADGVQRYGQRSARWLIE
jgi:hypothetical protein